MAAVRTKIEAARLLVYNAARRKSSGLPFTGQASMAKLYSSEVVIVECLIAGPQILLTFWKRRSFGFNEPLTEPYHAHNYVSWSAVHSVSGLDVMFHCLLLFSCFDSKLNIDADPYVDIMLQLLQLEMRTLWTGDFFFLWISSFDFIWNILFNFDKYWDGIP